MADIEVKIGDLVYLRMMVSGEMTTISAMVVRLPTTTSPYHHLQVDESSELLLGLRSEITLIEDPPPLVRTRATLEQWLSA